MVTELFTQWWVTSRNLVHVQLQKWLPLVAPPTVEITFGVVTPHTVEITYAPPPTAVITSVHPSHSIDDLLGTPYTLKW